MFTTAHAVRRGGLVAAAACAFGLMMTGPASAAAPSAAGTVQAASYNQQVAHRSHGDWRDRHHHRNCYWQLHDYWRHHHHYRYWTYECRHHW